ncbi:MAG: hypothetical protein AAFZ63_12920 [Bacteroidota bacterium]
MRKFFFLLLVFGIITACTPEQTVVPEEIPIAENYAEALTAFLNNPMPTNTKPLPEEKRVWQKDCGCTVQFLELPQVNSVWSLTASAPNSSGFNFNFGHDFLCPPQNAPHPYDNDLLDQIFLISNFESLEDLLEFRFQGLSTGTIDNCQELLAAYTPGTPCPDLSETLTVSFRFTCYPGFGAAPTVTDYTLALNDDVTDICMESPETSEIVVAPIEECKDIEVENPDLPGPGDQDDLGGL